MTRFRIMCNWSRDPHLQWIIGRDVDSGPPVMVAGPFRSRGTAARHLIQCREAHDRSVREIAARAKRRGRAGR